MIIGITGATGIVFGTRALEVLRGLGIETHLVVSAAGACDDAILFDAHAGLKTSRRT